MDTSQQPKERPILFSAPMVRAILDGRKTVTRRPVKGLKTNFPVVAAADGTPLRTGACWDIGGPILHCPFGKPGERMWVRETWYCDHDEVMRGPYLKPDDLDIREARDDGTLIYAADGLTPYEADQPVWKPNIHMPRWACRILLEITNVRVERLQDGEGETPFESRYVAEGIHRIHHGDGEYAFHPFKSEPGPGNWTDPFDAWRELWVSVNGSDSWNANPWVWVVEFKRVTP
ncbi:hypothetical protein [Pseudomonas mosselii]|uniref:hypothetical protein n=1 Tax=Pseudomonas mosselii TaxID=78327 RepID=UPI00202316AA|nr:hypothetical protein [Pseudomonas mosselii]MCL8299434.1 hypothetical protein [Pseudomonas mosselii]MCL8339708.1 hypothetical protein [Pseudomonas mosselii]